MPSHYSQVQRTIGAELLVRRLCDGLEAMPFAVKRDHPSTPAIACWTFSERFELCSRWRWAASWKRADQQLNKATSLHTVAVWLRLGDALPLLLNNGVKLQARRLGLRGEHTKPRGLPLLLPQAKLQP